MLTTCREPGCATLVMGGRCIEHERRPARIFVRGRPFVPFERNSTDVAGGAVAMFATTGLRTEELWTVPTGPDRPF